MDDNMLLAAIGQMMDEKLDQAKKEIAAQTAQQLQEAQREIARDTVTLMDAEFKGKFDLLAEELKSLRDLLPTLDQLEQMQETVDMHHVLLRQHTREIANLKKAT